MVLSLPPAPRPQSLLLYLLSESLFPLLFLLSLQTSARWVGGEYGIGENLWSYLENELMVTNGKE